MKDGTCPNWRRSAKSIAAEARGRRGESLAADYLRGQGWEILASRVKTPRGEVDLIARRRGLGFVDKG